MNDLVKEASFSLRAVERAMQLSGVDLVTAAADVVIEGQMEAIRAENPEMTKEQACVALGQNVARTVVQVLWAQQGYNAIQMTPSLCASLLLTDTSSEIERARLPFSGVLVHVPPGFIEVDGQDCVALLCGEGEMGAVGDVVSMTLYPKEGSSARVGVANVARSKLIEKGFARISQPSDPRMLKPFDERQSSMVERAWRLVVGLCLYVSMTKDVEPRDKKTHRRSPESGRPWPSHWVVGRKVSIDSSLKAAAMLGGESDAQWRLRAQHVVRGHWRNQACGVGRSERRLTWIQPHMRGPEGEQAWSHVYDVK